eukprot:7153086-Pyramimonas_sp.AAC.1
MHFADGRLDPNTMEWEMDPAKGIELRRRHGKRDGASTATAPMGPTTSSTCPRSAPRRSSRAGRAAPSRTFRRHWAASQPS